MSALVFILTVFYLLGDIVCPPHHEHHDDVACYHCDHHAHHDHFPECLHRVHMCHHDELCYMSNKHGHFEVRCRPHHDCHHVPGTCSYYGDCEVCCQDAACISQHVTNLFHLGTTVVPTSAPSTAASTTAALLATATTSYGWLTDNCRDNLFDGTCHTLLPAVCQDKAGITICPETCGLCSLFKQTFHANGSCTDRLIINDCETLKTKQGLCSGAWAEISCPKTCNLCDKLVETLITHVISTHKTTTAAATVPSVTDVTVVSPPVAQCYECSDLSCFVMRLVSCPVGQDYCMNTISQSSTGQRSFTKGCVTESACDDEWWLHTAGLPNCFLLDNAPTGPAGMPLPKCSFCCRGEGCNRDAIPPTHFLYNPNNKVPPIPDDHS